MNPSDDDESGSGAAATGTTVPPAEEFARCRIVQEVEEVKVVEAKPSGGGWGWGPGGWFSAATSAVRRVMCDVTSSCDL
jgi:hypothetical protein